MGLMEHLSSIEPPWVELLILPQRKVLQTVVENLDKFITVTIDGPKCTTKTGLFSVFGRALKFPPYFGNNWDAFEECINDLKWVPSDGYLVMIVNAEHLLLNSEHDYKTFVDIMQKAGANWAKQQTGEKDSPSVPFHVLLTISDKKELGIRDWGVPLLSIDS